jgi:transposase-like protein
VKYLNNIVEQDHRFITEVTRKIEPSSLERTGRNRSLERVFIPALRWLKFSEHRCKRLIKPGLGFFSFQSAWRTLQGYEVMNIMRKGQMQGIGKGDNIGQVVFIASLFGIVA